MRWLRSQPDSGSVVLCVWLRPDLVGPPPQNSHSAFATRQSTIRSRSLKAKGLFIFARSQGPVATRQRVCHFCLCMRPVSIGRFVIVIPEAAAFRSLPQRESSAMPDFASLLGAQRTSKLLRRERAVLRSKDEFAAHTNRRSRPAAPEFASRLTQLAIATAHRSKQRLRRDAASRPDALCQWQLCDRRDRMRRPGSMRQDRDNGRGTDPGHCRFFSKEFRRSRRGDVEGTFSSSRKTALARRCSSVQDANLTSGASPTASSCSPVNRTTSPREAGSMVGNISARRKIRFEGSSCQAPMGYSRA